MIVQGMFLGTQVLGHAQRSVGVIQAQRMVGQMQGQSTFATFNRRC